VLLHAQTAPQAQLLLLHRLQPLLVSTVLWDVPHALMAQHVKLAQTDMDFNRTIASHVPPTNFQLEVFHHALHVLLEVFQLPLPAHAQRVLLDALPAWMVLAQTVSPVLPDTDSVQIPAFNALLDFLQLEALTHAKLALLQLSRSLELFNALLVQSDVLAVLL